MLKSRNILSGVEGSSLVCRLLICLVTLYVINLFFLYQSHPPFSPDSWSYYELSQTVFHRPFYHINTIRQFQFNGLQGVSFPPLYPMTIALFNSLFRYGIYGGYAVNFLITLATLGVLIKLSKILCNYRCLGIVFYLILLLNPRYLDELVSARSIPLLVLIFFFTTYIFVKNPDLSLRSIGILGVLSGLGTMSRFDYLIPALTIGIVIILSQRSKTLLGLAKIAFAYYGSFIVVSLPWIIYSYVHFHTFFVSDNSRTAILANPSFVTDYYPATNLPTLFNNPGLWIHTVLQKSSLVIRSLGQSLKSESPVPLLIIIDLFLISLTVFKNGVVNLKRQLSKYYLFLTPLLFLLFVTCLSGYPDKRYFIIITLYLEIALILMALRLIHHVISEKMRLSVIIVITTFVMANIILIAAQTGGYQLSKSFRFTFVREDISSVEYTDVINTLKLSKAPPRVMIDEYIHFKFGALTGLVSMIVPNNLDPTNFDQFVLDYQPTHIYSHSLNNIKYLSSNYNCKQIESLPMCELTRK